MVYYIKSLENDLITKRVVGTKKVNVQSLDNMVKTKTIIPNTASFGRKFRLACTVLHKNYTKTYRSQGIIFQTTQKPDSVSPFDLVLLTNAKKLVVQYYRIEHNLHEYYNHTLIPGYEQFVFKTFDEMIKKYPSPKKVWAAVNSFRKKAGFTQLPLTKFKLIEYNEAVFQKVVKIKPVALYGYRPEVKRKAKELGLPHFRTAKAFYDSL